MNSSKPTGDKFLDNMRSLLFILDYLLITLFITIVSVITTLIFVSHSLMGISCIS